MIIIVMGVAGSGKTTVGGQLATRLRCRFIDADTFHPPASIEKMRQGIPLTEQDRLPWLAALREQVISDAAASPVVLACSCLKAAHRQFLSAGRQDVRYVYLRVPEAVARARLARRQDHFAGESLAASQFQALEEPADAVAIDASLPVPLIVDTIVRSMNLQATDQISS